MIGLGSPAVDVLLITLLLTVAKHAAGNPLPRCDPGSFFVRASGTCANCTAGVDFTDEHNRQDECTPCASCNGGRKVKSACTTKRNTLCGCGDDEYEHSDGCSPKLGSNDKDIYTQLQMHGNAISNLSAASRLYYDTLLAQLKEHIAAIKNWSLTTTTSIDLLTIELQDHRDRVKNLSFSVTNHYTQCSDELKKLGYAVKNLSLIEKNRYAAELRARSGLFTNTPSHEKNHGEQLLAIITNLIECISTMQLLQEQFFKLPTAFEDFDERTEGHWGKATIVLSVAVISLIAVIIGLLLHQYHICRKIKRRRINNICGTCINDRSSHDNHGDYTAVAGSEAATENQVTASARNVSVMIALPARQIESTGPAVSPPATPVGSVATESTVTSPPVLRPTFEADVYAAREDISPPAVAATAEARAANAVDRPQTATTTVMDAATGSTASVTGLTAVSARHTTVAVPTNIMEPSQAAAVLEITAPGAALAAEGTYSAISSSERYSSRAALRNNEEVSVSPAKHAVAPDVPAPQTANVATMEPSQRLGTGEGSDSTSINEETEQPTPAGALADIVHESTAIANESVAVRRSSNSRSEHTSFLEIKGQQSLSAPVAIANTAAPPPAASRRCEEQQHENYQHNNASVSSDDEPEATSSTPFVSSAQQRKKLQEQFSLQSVAKQVAEIAE